MWKSKNDSHTCLLAFSSKPTTSSRSLDYIGPFRWSYRDNTNESFVALQVCLQCLGSQEVRMVEGGVRRWEAHGGRHISGGGRGQIWWQGFSCLEQPWHYDIVDSQKHTLAHPAQRHVDPVTSSTSSENLRTAFKVCFKRCCSKAESQPRFVNLKRNLWIEVNTQPELLPLFPLCVFCCCIWSRWCTVRQKSN